MAKDLEWIFDKLTWSRPIKLFLNCLNSWIATLDSRRVNFPNSFWQNPGPRNGEPVVCGPHFADQPRIVLVLVVTVTCDLAIGTIGNVSIYFSECVPNAGTFSIIVVASLYLWRPFVIVRPKRPDKWVPSRAVPDMMMWRHPKQILWGKFHKVEALHIWIWPW